MLIPVVHEELGIWCAREDETVDTRCRPLGMTDQKTEDTVQGNLPYEPPVRACHLMIVAPSQHDETSEDCPDLPFDGDGSIGIRKARTQTTQ